jgi:hypothetical protein
MRVTITHHDIRKGFPFPKTYYEVRLTVALSHEEKQIIRQRNLTQTRLMNRRPATAKTDDRDAKFELRVGNILNGQTDRFLCATPSAAKIYEEELLRMLEQVKLWVTDNAESGTRRVIEF